MQCLVTKRTETGDFIKSAHFKIVPTKNVMDILTGICIIFIHKYKSFREGSGRNFEILYFLKYNRVKENSG